MGHLSVDRSHDLFTAEVQEEQTEFVEGIVEEMQSGDDLCQAESMDTEELEKVIEELGQEVDSVLPSIEELAAIPEASPKHASARQSKRRADVADEEAAIMAKLHKAYRNEGNTENHSLSFDVPDRDVIWNLDGIGITLGKDQICISGSVCSLKCKVVSRDHSFVKVDRKTQVLEKEEEDLLEEYELEKFVLKNLCSEIMDDVMDLGSD
jgi:hypothetical protein